MQDQQKCVEILSVVARGMKDLKNEVVFIGGVTTFAYIDSPVALEVRPTDDVDCAVEMTSVYLYEELKEKLLSLGFKNDSSKGAPTCRWLFNDIKVDVMPTSQELLGFTNSWYTAGIKNKIRFALPNSEEIFLFSLAYFFASKLEAYNSRGQNDPRTSTDIEDILLVIDGAEDPVSAVQKADTTVRIFLNQQFLLLSGNDIFQETIDGLFQREGNERITKVKSLVDKLSRKF